MICRHSCARLDGLIKLGPKTYGDINKLPPMATVKAAKFCSINREGAMTCRRPFKSNAWTSLVLFRDEEMHQASRRLAVA